MYWDSNAAGALQTDGGAAWLDTDQWWDGSINTTWASGDDAVFGNGGTGGAVTLASSTIVNSLTFNAFSGTYDLGTAGNAITLNNGITMNAGAGAVNILSPITLGAAQSWTNNSSSLLTVGTDAITNGGFLLTIGGTGNTTISGAISGTGGLTMSGSGTLTLSGANAYTGATTVNSGTLVFSGANRIPSAAASIASGATLVLATGSSDLRTQGAVTFTGAGVVQKTGSGMWVLGATGVTGGGYAAAPSGGTNANVIFNQSAGGFLDVNGGDINSGWYNTSFTTNNGSLNVASGASFHTSNPTFQFDSLTGSGVIGNAYNSAVTMTIGVANNANNALYGVAGNTATFSGSIRNSETYNGVTTAALSLVKTGTGTQILSGTNNYTGTTTVSGGTLSLTRSLTGGGAISTSGTGVFTQGASGLISGASSFTQGSSGTSTLSGANNYTGTTTVSGGTLSLTGSLNGGGAISTSGTGVFTQGASGSISGASSFTQGSSGISTLSGINTFTGTTTVNAGTLTLANALALQNSALVTTGAGTVALSGVTTPTIGGLSGASGNLASVITSGYSGVTNLILNPQAGSITYGGVIANGVSGMSLTKTGAGTQILEGANTYSGGTFINAGTLTLSGAAGSILNSAITLYNGGTLSLINTSPTEAAVNRVNDSTAIISNGGSVTVTNTASATTVYAETMGALDLRAGQLNITQTNANTADVATQTLTFGSGSLTNVNGGARTAAITSAINFSGASLGANVRNTIVITGQATTVANEIIAPWATYGSSAGSQTDYAVYNRAGSGGATNSLGIQAANITATTQDFWSTSTNAYTMGATNVLTATRTITALRYTGGTTLTLASGANLETYGLLNGGTTNWTVDPGTGGVLTTPTGGGNLYLTTGNANLIINAPINDNNGAVTLVKNGSSSNLTLGSTASNYSGGTVLNAGLTTVTADSNLGAITGGVTFNGTATLSGGVTYNSSRSFTINQGAIATISGAATIAGQVTGTGTLVHTDNTTLTLSHANNSFTGAISVNGGTSAEMRAFSLSDAAGSGAITLGSGTQGNFTWTGGEKSFANRQFILAGTGQIGNFGSAALTITSDVGFSGSGTRNLKFGTILNTLITYSGAIRDNGASATSVDIGTLSNGNLSNGGIVALSGTNTYSGATTIASVSNGGFSKNQMLIFQGKQAVSPYTAISASKGNHAAVEIRFLDDGVGTINLGNAVTWSQNGDPNFILFVGNNSTANGGNSAGGTTGSTIAIGNLSLTGTSTTGVTLNGANGYRLQASSLTLNATSGGTIATITANNPFTVAGNVILGAGSGSTASTISLAGSAAGNFINGTISNPSSGLATIVSKSGSGSWTLAGTNTYTGGTNVSGGLLRFTGNSSAANGAVAVSGGALGGNGGSLGGAVTVSGTGGLDLRDSLGVGTLTLGNSLSITGAAGANNLYFDLGNNTGTSDQISVAGATTVTTSGAAVININQLGGLAGRNATTYTLIGGAGALAAADFGRFSLATTKAFGQTYSLTNASNDLQLVATNVTGAVLANTTLSGTNPSWQTAGNFSGAAIPDYQSNVIINSNIGTTGALNASVDINSLTYGTSATTSTTVTPGTAATGTPFNMLVIEAANANGNTAGNGITVNTPTSGTPVHTISANIGLAASQTWTVNTGGALTVSGVISDFGLGNSLTKAGAGTLTISAAPTYTGATTISGGLLDTSGFAPASFSTSSIIFSGNSTFKTGNSSNLALPSMTVNSGVTATFDGGGGGNNTTYTMAALTSGSSTSKFVVTSTGGSGRGITFGSLAGFTGTLEYNIGASGGFYLTTPDLTDTASTFIRMSTPNTSATTLAFNYIGNSNLTLNNRRFELFGTTANTTYNINNNGVGTFTINTNLLVSATGAKILGLGGTGASVFGGSIGDGTSAVISLTKNGTGTWHLTNANTYSGTTTINGGTLRLSGGNNRLLSTGTVAFTAASTFDIGSTSQTLSSITVPDLAGFTSTITGSGGSLIINGASDLQWGPGGAVTTNSYNTVVNLSGLSSFTYNASGNTFRVGYKVGTTNTTGNGSSVVRLATDNTITAANLHIANVGASNLGGSGTLQLGQTNAINADVINVGTGGRSNATLQYRTTGLSGTPTVTIRGTAGGAARVTTWEVGKVATFAGGTTDWTSTVDFSSGGSTGGQLDARVTNLNIGIADTGAQTNRAGNQTSTFTMGQGTLDVTNLSIGLLLGSTGGDIGAQYTSTGTFTLNHASGLVTAENIYLGVINNSFTGAFTTNTTGTFNLTAGTLEAKVIDYGASAPTGLGSATRNFNFTSGTIRNYAGSNLAIANVPINLTGSGTRYFEATAGQSITVASTSGIAGLGQGFTKAGTGTLILAGTNTYTGATTVSQGVLAVNGSIASAVTVASGATLQGSGTISSSVTINGGGTLAAGNSIESLASGNLTLAAAAILAYEMNNDAAAGVAGDLTAVTGNLSIANTTTILTLNELGAGSWTAGEKLTLIAYSGTWNNGLFSYSSSTLADDSTITFSGTQWTFNYNDTSAGTNYTGDLTGMTGYVTMTAIPEPGVAMLGGLSLLGLFLRRRRA